MVVGFSAVTCADAGVESAPSTVAISIVLLRVISDCYHSSADAVCCSCKKAAMEAVRGNPPNRLDRLTMTMEMRDFAKVLLLSLSSGMLLLTAGCGRQKTPPTEAAAGVESNSQVPSAFPGIAATPARSIPAVTPAALYEADLVLAVAGREKVPFPPAVAGMGGMRCSPGTLSGTSPRDRTLTLTLPADAAARHHVLAVVTPERGLLEIYTPYDDSAAETGDLLIPTQTISWSKARTRNRFTISTDDFDGLRPDKTTPEVLFLEPGRYRFALVNGIDAALLKANHSKVQVTAACSVDWSP